MKITVSFSTRSGLMSTWYLKGVIAGYVSHPGQTIAVVLTEPEQYKAKDCDEECIMVVRSSEPRRLIDVPLRDLHILSTEE